MADVKLDENRGRHMRFGEPGMSGHEPGRLGVCPICGKRFTNDDRDVDLYSLRFTRHTGEPMAPQTIWWRIHRQCAGFYPFGWGRRLAGLYVKLGGIGIVDDSLHGQYGTGRKDKE